MNIGPRPRTVVILILFLCLSFSTLLRAQTPPEFVAGRIVDLGAPETNFILSDVNDDGQLDIVSTHSIPQELRVHLNDGSGNFGAPFAVPLPFPTNYFFSGPSDGIATGDLTENGHIDIVVASHSDNALMLFEGDGAGSFTQFQIFFSVTDGLTFPLVADFNDDNHLDVGIVASESEEVSVILGEGFAGLVTEQVFGNFAGGAVSVASIGDFNEDGTPDLAVASHTFGKSVDGFLSVLMSDGLGGMAMGNSIMADPPYGIVTADFDEDGHLDVIVGGFRSTRAYLGDGDGGFPSSRNVGFQFLRDTFIALDFDGDGHEDIARVDFPSLVRVKYGLGDGGFSDSINFSSLGDHLRGGDVTGDGFPDLVVGDVATGVLSIHRGRGNKSFETASSVIEVAEGAAVVLIGDFDENGIPDALVGTGGTVCGFNSGTRILLGDGGGGFTIRNVGAAGPYILGDFNEDGHVDMVAQCVYFEGDGTGSFVRMPPSTLLFLVNVVPLTSGVAVDLDLDGHLDIVWAIQDFGNSYFYWVHGNGDGTFGPWDNLAVDEDGFNSVKFEVACGDWNDDGIVDLLMVGHSSTMPYFGITFGDGSGSFGLPDIRIPIADGARSLVPCDLNQDGCLDVVFAHGDSGGVSVILGSGNETVSPPLRFFTGGYLDTVHPADMDGDGHLDLVVTSVESWYVGILRGDGEGNFDLTRRYRTDAGKARGVGALDLDGSGHPSLIVATFDGRIPEGFVTILRNEAAPRDALAGTVNLDSGAQTNVLFVNGSAGFGFDRRIFVKLLSLIEVALNAAPLGPSIEAEYFLWVWIGDQNDVTPFLPGGNDLGLTINATPFDRSGPSQPLICLRSGEVMNVACRGTQERTGPDFVPWMVTNSRGFSNPRVFKLQGLIQDASATNPFGYSITNGITLEIE